MMDVTRGSQGEVVIRFEGTFDSSEASRLAGWLREVPVQEPLVVDFGAARDCHDHGLAAIASALTGRTQVTVRGLSRHQEKLLRYFGLDLGGPSGPRQAAG
jgi:hypothetical protein